MNPDYLQLVQRLTILENTIKNQSTNFNEKVRDVVIYDIDNVSTRTNSTTLVDGTHPLTYPKVPDTYLRVRFRGKTYNIPAYNLT